MVSPQRIRRRRQSHSAAAVRASYPEMTAAGSPGPPAVAVTKAGDIASSEGSSARYRPRRSFPSQISRTRPSSPAATRNPSKIERSAR